MEINEELLKKELMLRSSKFQAKLKELIAAADMARLGYEMQEAECRDIYNQILNDNCFYAAMNCEECGIAIGDRITSEENDFLLSDEDFKRMTELAHLLFVERGLTDDNGYYLTNWLEILCDAKRECVDFIIGYILPQSLREPFQRNRLNVVVQDKLIGVFKAAMVA